MEKKKLISALEKALEAKGKRKFAQSVELIVNFRGIDFSKPENRLNLDIPLPHGKGGKEPKIVVIGDGAFGSEAKKAGADEALTPEQLPALAADTAKLKKLANESVFLAQPNQIAAVAKNLGQYLGKRGKMPRPLVGQPKAAIETAKRAVRVASKGKYLPTAQALIGSESMEPEKLAENAEAVYDAIKGKTGEGNIKSAFVKLTMGRAERVM